MKLLVPALASALLFTACSKPAEQAAPEGGGAPAEAAATGTPIPTPDITISTAAADITKGQEVFAAKGCPACHKVGGGRLVGPDLKGVTARRQQEWIERMILRPDIMVKEDPEAKKLLGTYFTPMPNQNVDPQKDLPFILAYLKANET